MTDNASNMEIAAKTADLHPQIGCFAHTDNSACQRGLTVSALGRLLGRIRKVVSFFHRSTTATAVLKSKQQQLSLPIHKIVQDVQTRWNSSYEMIQRYLKQEPAIHAALSSPEIKKNVRDVVTLSCDDISEAEHVLEPLKTVANIMCAEHSPSLFNLSNESSYSRKYGRKCARFKSCEGGETSYQRQSNKAIHKKEETAEFLLLCAALDPRFKCIPRLEPDQRDEVYGNIERKILLLGDGPVKVSTKKLLSELTPICGVFFFLIKIKK